MPSLRHHIDLVEAASRVALNEDTNKTEWTFYHGTKSEAFDMFAPQSAAKGEQYWNPLGNGMYATNNPRFAANFGHRVHKVIIPVGSTYRRINDNQWRSVGGGLVTRAVKIAFKQRGENFDYWRNGAKQKPFDGKRMTREQQVEFLVAHHGPKYEAQVRERLANATPKDILMYIKHATEETGRVRDPAKSNKVLDFLVQLARFMNDYSPYEGLYESAELVQICFGRSISDAYHDALPKVSDAAFSKYDFVVFSSTNDAIGMEDNKGNIVSSHEIVIFNPALQKTVARS